MRRNEFNQSDEQQEIEAFLQEMSFGYLASVRPDGTPGITPLNFVYYKGNIYFHGSRAGEKMKSISAFGEVSFCVAKEYAIIPSYFSDPLLACPATAYFKSVLLRGTAAPLSDLSEKAEALEAMMAKLQPEGGYKTIDGEDPDYIPRLKGVAVVKLAVTELTAKFKFGQNLKEDEREQVADQLQQRGCPFDSETARLMHHYAPGNNEGA